MEFESLDEFNRDLKKLLKKYRSLNEDLETIKKVLRVQPNETPPFSFQISGLGIQSPPYIIKVKKITCKSLKGKGVNTGLRLVYALYEEDPRIVFVELYHKNVKALEDRDRILAYFKS